ncbi:ABC transporter substrate-binding protein [Acuticoccus sp.]|uniref:ABC transporter substrate-binding protein n=1 Tax=Acuticoccus sp. TaxID=1904378 RepID=UPI003B51BA83
MTKIHSIFMSVLCLSSGYWLAAPAAAQGEDPSTLRATMHADVRVLDPHWTTQTIAGIHGMLIYDTLFGVDADGVPQPQMVDDYVVSDDGLVHTFTLRDGLRFHDGSDVTTADVIASLQRWGAADQAGRAMFAFVDSLEAQDDKTFTMTLSEPYGLVPDTLGKAGTMVPIIMREEDAATPGDQQVTEAIGSGPFKMVKEEWVPGSVTVYAKNEDYVPRDEPPSGLAGGKEPKVDRIELVWIEDSQTKMQALTAGEIDLLEQPAVDFVPILEATPDVEVIRTGVVDSTWGTIRINHLHPPFDNPEMRRALYHLVNQEDFLRTVVGDPQYYRTCYSYITCGTTYEDTTNAETISDYDPKKAYEMMKAAGYNDEPITVLAATDHHTITPAAQVLLNAMREAGLNVNAVSIDWGSVVARRSNREKPEDGGWNIFVTTSSGTTALNPALNTWLGASCETANVGWPCDEELESLRQDFAFAQTEEERKEVAKSIQQRATEVVPYISFGQWTQPLAYRSDQIDGIVPVTGLTVLWNIEKVDD